MNLQEKDETLHFLWGDLHYGLFEACWVVVVRGIQFSDLQRGRPQSPGPRRAAGHAGHFRRRKAAHHCRDTVTALRERPPDATGKTADSQHPTRAASQPRHLPAACPGAHQSPFVPPRSAVRGTRVHVCGGVKIVPGVLGTLRAAFHFNDNGSLDFLYRYITHIVIPPLLQ